MPNEVLLLKQAFDSALEAAAPAVCLPPALKAYPRKPALVLGTGKAAASMTAAFCGHWDASTRGLVVTRYGHGLKAGETSGGVEVVEAGHPSPDAASLAAGARLLELAAGARDGEYLICLISGGGSSLAAAPLPPITFEQKRAIRRDGAAEAEILRGLVTDRLHHRIGHADMAQLDVLDLLRPDGRKAADSVRADCCTGYSRAGPENGAS